MFGGMIETLVYFVPAFNWDLAKLVDTFLLRESFSLTLIVPYSLRRRELNYREF